MSSCFSQEKCKHGEGHFIFGDRISKTECLSDQTLWCLTFVPLKQNWEHLCQLFNNNSNKWASRSFYLQCLTAGRVLFSLLSHFNDLTTLSFQFGVKEPSRSTPLHPPTSSCTGKTEPKSGNF